MRSRLRIWQRLRIPLPKGRHRVWVQRAEARAPEQAGVVSALLHQEGVLYVAEAACFRLVMGEACYSPVVVNRNGVPQQYLSVGVRGADQSTWLIQDEGRQYMPFVVRLLEVIGT